MENVGGPDPDPPSANNTWEFLANPWLLALIAAAAYYAYQNYLPTLKRNFTSQETAVTPQDEEKVRKMMEARNKQQAIYDNAAKELEDKRKEEPPTKLGPISKQIAAKAKLRPDYNPLMGDSGTCAPRRTARQPAAGG